MVVNLDVGFFGPKSPFITVGKAGYNNAILITNANTLSLKYKICMKNINVNYLIFLKQLLFKVPPST